MTKVVVLTDRCTLGEVGKTVDVPDGVNVKALVRAGHVKYAPKKKPAKAPAKKAVR